MFGVAVPSPYVQVTGTLLSTTPEASILTSK